jgi:signal transduction histidine kinase
MAEVATGVLHNVGNVLNSVNVGAGIVTSKIRELRVDNLSTAVKMLEEHTHDLSSFVEKDPKGQRVVPYLVKLAQHLQGERIQVLHELESLTEHIDHIKEVVATQQDYAKVSALTEIVSIPKLLDQALKMVEASLTRHHVEVIREVDDVPDLALAKHKVIEILVNLIRNAEQAVLEQSGPVLEVRIKVKRHSPDRIRIEIHDTGVGLSPENLTRIFAHGFTTKSNGHGFGLHSGALAAKQMGGSLWAESKGTGLGATFVLELPATAAVNAPAMSTI